MSTLVSSKNFSGTLIRACLKILMVHCVSATFQYTRKTRRSTFQYSTLEAEFPYRSSFHIISKAFIKMTTSFILLAFSSMPDIGNIVLHLISFKPAATSFVNWPTLNTQVFNFFSQRKSHLWIIWHIYLIFYKTTEQMWCHDRQTRLQNSVQPQNTE